MTNEFPDELWGAEHLDVCPACRLKAAEERAARGEVCSICFQDFHNGEPTPGPCHRCRPPAGVPVGLVTAGWAAAWEASQRPPEATLADEQAGMDHRDADRQEGAA